mmetsp:Transcript_33655/g.56582  ORF Transcript_33655/g.56582 Transcript_33655/m.56582 type:complete len:118 (-) Transcript_33655:294-647(-)
MCSKNRYCIVFEWEPFLNWPQDLRCMYPQVSVTFLVINQTGRVLPENMCSLPHLSNLHVTKGTAAVSPSAARLSATPLPARRPIQSLPASLAAKYFLLLKNTLSLQYLDGLSSLHMF